MAIETICSPDAIQIIQNVVYPLTAISAVVTAVVIGISYMIGNVLSSTRLVVWSKTEIFQLFISLAAVGIVLFGIDTFCLIDMSSMYDLFDVGATGVPPNLNVYSAAEAYLVESGAWTHDLMLSARYHLGAYSLMQMFGRNYCEGDPAYAWLFCLFGAVLPSVTGGSGASSITTAPDAGYGLMTSVLGAAFNAITLSYLSILNYIFVLRYVFSGFVLFFLPLGIFLRALPYVRALGSLLMSVAISFLMIYPLVLAVFYIDFHAAQILAPDSPAFQYSSHDISEKVHAGYLFNPAQESLDWVVFDQPGGDQSVEIIKLSGNAFLLGVFIPSLALLSAAAAVGYINRFLGQEIDLSRIMQLM